PHLLFACVGSSDRLFFFFSSRRRHTRSKRDWSSDVCSSDLVAAGLALRETVPVGVGGGVGGRGHGQSVSGERGAREDDLDGVLGSGGGGGGAGGGGVRGDIYESGLFTLWLRGEVAAAD